MQLILMVSVLKLDLQVEQKKTEHSFNHIQCKNPFRTITQCPF